MKSKRKYVRPDTAAAARLQKAIADGGIFHAYLFEGSSRSNEELAGWFAAAALCECRDGRICGECVHCRQIADGVSPYIVRVKTAAEEVPADERFEKRITENPAGSGRKTEKKRGTKYTNWD